MKTLVFLLLLVSLTFNQSPHVYNHCRVSIVGAGTGGIYAAWRLVTDPKSPIQASEICIFEALPHHGGRMYPLTASKTPLLRNYSLVVEGGAYHYLNWQTILRALIEDVFQIPNRCYEGGTYEAVFPNRTIEGIGDLKNGCPSSAVPKFLFLRGKFIPRNQFDNSTFWPYRFKEAEKWDNQTRRTLRDKIIDAYPGSQDLINRLKNASESEHLNLVRDAENRLRETKMNGIPLWEIDSRGYLEKFFSTEYIKSEVSSQLFGEAYHRYNLHDWIIYEFATLGAYMGGKRIAETAKHYSGFRTVLDHMIDDLRKANTSIFYNHRLIDIFKENGNYTLVFSDMSSLRYAPIVAEARNSNVVILNMFPSQVKQLRRDSIIFKNKRFRDCLASTADTGTHKIFLIYKNAWWVDYPELRTASVWGDDLLEHFRYYDAPINCTGNQLNSKNCSGVLFASYRWAKDKQILKNLRFTGNASWWDPCVVIQDENVLKRFHNSVCNYHKHLDVNITFPQAAIYCDWKGEWFSSGPVYLPTKKCPPSLRERLFYQPVPYERIFLTNDGFAKLVGWAEGPLRMSEEIVHKYFGLQKPSWLSSEFYHTYFD